MDLEIEEVFGQASLPNGRSSQHRSYRTDLFQIIYLADLGKIIMETKDFPILIAELNKIIRIIDDARVDSENNKIRYYEIHLGSSHKGNRNPHNALKKKIEKKKRKAYEGIFNTELENFSLRLCSPFTTEEGKSIKDMIPWFDFRVFPRISDPSLYGIDLVYRTSKRREFRKFIKKLIPNIKDVIDELDGGR